MTRAASKGAVAAARDGAPCPAWSPVDGSWVVGAASLAVRPYMLPPGANTRKARPARRSMG